VDVGGFAEPRKNCVSVLYPLMSNYQYTPGPRMGVTEFPNTHHTLVLAEATGKLPKWEKIVKSHKFLIARCGTNLNQSLETIQNPPCSWKVFTYLSPSKMATP
jgi:hypothetical protein